LQFGLAWHLSWQSAALAMGYNSAMSLYGASTTLVRKQSMVQKKDKLLFHFLYGCFGVSNDNSSKSHNSNKF
jgi:hypothetical protein